MNGNNLDARAVPAGKQPGAPAHSWQRAYGIATTPRKQKTRNPYSKNPPTVTPVNPYKKLAATSERGPSCASTKRTLDFSDEGVPPSRTRTAVASRHFSMAGERGSRPASPTAIELRNAVFDPVNIDPSKTYTLYFDGGSRGNPGIAGGGMALYDGTEEVWHGKQYIGDKKTNNEAEYTALVTGLNCVRALGVERIRVKGDSNLVVSQVSGKCHCRAPRLRDLLQQVINVKCGFKWFDISHIYRNENKRADALANAAMDEKVTDLGVVEALKREDDLTMSLTMSLSMSRSQIEECDLMVANAMRVESTASDAVLVENSEDKPCSPASYSTSRLPFLVQFEVERFGLRGKSETGNFGNRLRTTFDAHRGKPSLTSELISLIYEEKEALSKAPYDDFLKRCCSNGSCVDEADSCLFLFHAKLTEAGIRLLQPEPADLETRRIHRRYGSHRFLDLHCDEKCTKTLAALRKHLNPHLREGKLELGGREYGVLCSHPPGKKVILRLFAEKGVGIRKRDEITAPQVAARCIPASLNPNISLAQYMKRMKLSFTTTVPTLVLKPGMLEVIEDIKADGDDESVMTDGCGLISREAMNQVYAEYTRNLQNRQIALGNMNPIHHTGASCPYSSFQGRIGGIKGMFVVDGSLPGVKVQVRTSQLKYDVPITKKAMSIFIDTDDTLYHTIEVKEWDRVPPPAHLSVNTIQLLEERGVPSSYFLSLAKTAVDELSPTRGNYESLTMKFRARKFLKDTHSLFEDDLLMRMLHAQVPLDEPVMMHNVNQFINDELKMYREKSRYPVIESKYLRMLPDHTGLLESDEAFVALGDEAAQYEVERLGSIVAMRLPSYFVEDMRKLRIASKSDLLQRCPEKSKFFNGIVCGIVLSTGGVRSEADMMSGGDYDGDRAWCCWNETVVSNVEECPGHNVGISPPVDPFKQRPLAYANPAWTNLIISYTMHHRNDKKILGILAKTLETIRDKGYGSGEINEVASKAFLQVDDPHKAQWTDSDARMYGSLSKPHWSTLAKTGKSYRSKKVLGKLFDMLDGAELKDISYNDIEPAMNIHIQEKIERARKKDSNEVEKIRKDMLSRLKSFNQTVGVRISTFDLGDQLQRRMKDKTVSDMYKQHRFEIESSYDVDDLPKVFAILYEQTYFESRERMTRWKKSPYLFAWKIGHDYLTRIIADGEARKNCIGIAPTIARGKYQLMFGRKR